MLFEFKSRATGSVVMTDDVGKKVLPLIGKTPDPKGIITVEQIPAAIAALEAACERENELAAAARDKARNPTEGTTDNGQSEDDPHAERFPHLELLRNV